MHSIISKIIST